MSEHEVVIAGGGPTGLMLAAELSLAGVDVVVVERRASQALDGSRAGGLHPRTIEVLDQRGVAERFLEEGQRHPAAGYAYIPLDIGDLATRHPYLLALWQADFERILAGWVLDDLGVTIRRSCEVKAFNEHDDGVDVELSDGSVLRAAYLVGCDGGRSTVRKGAGIGFPGLDASTSWVIAEVEMADEPEVGIRPEGGGIGPVDPASAGGPYRVALKEEELRTEGVADLEDVRRALVHSCGSDYGVHSPTWVSRFTDACRQAAAYRRGRVLLAGDAAHVHPPHGGQGLNTGVQDAVNLGWKLAQVVRGTSPGALLDTYHAERHPVGARVLRSTMAQVALTLPDERHRALHATVAELLTMEEPRRRTAAMLTALDVRYDLGAGHPLIGLRMPDLDLETPDGPKTVFELLHRARPVLLHQGGPSLPAGWSSRVREVEARSPATWPLPVGGEAGAPAAVLIRPDGHVAWAGDVADPGLAEALTTWFGPVAPRR